VESILSNEEGVAHEFRVYFDNPYIPDIVQPSDSSKAEFEEVTDNIMKRFKRGMYSCRICFESVRTDLSYVMFADGTVINNFKSLQENLLEEIRATESQKLRKLSSMLQRQHTVEVAPGYFCHFKVKYLFPLQLRNDHELIEHIAMVVQIIDGFILTTTSRPRELDDFVAETLDGSSCSTLGLLCGKLEPYLKHITHMFGYDHVFIQQFKFLDESNS
jgi:hypothetical protein